MQQVSCGRVDLAKALNYLFKQIDQEGNGPQLSQLILVCVIIDTYCCRSGTLGNPWHSHQADDLRVVDNLSYTCQACGGRAGQ